MGNDTCYVRRSKNTQKVMCSINIECCNENHSNSCFNNDSTESSSKTKIIIGVILIVCLIIGLGVYFGIHYDKDFENQETTTRVTLSTTTIKTTISTSKTTTTTTTTTKVTSTTFNKRKCGGYLYQSDISALLIISYIMLCFGFIGIFLHCPFLFIYWGIDEEMDILFFTWISCYLLNITSASCFLAFYHKRRLDRFHSCLRFQGTHCSQFDDHYSHFS